jgi:hypothetical protein
VGIIIGSKGCSADEAFELLTRQSQHENRKLRDVAIDLVTSKLRSGRSTSQSARGAGAFSEMETRSAIEVGQRWQTVGAHDEWFCDSPHTEHASRVVATAMIVAGILGNVIDRLVLGSVRDFLAFPGNTVVNVADIALVVGISMAGIAVAAAVVCGPDGPEPVRPESVRSAVPRPAR